MDSDASLSVSRHAATHRIRSKLARREDVVRQAASLLEAPLTVVIGTVRDGQPLRALGYSVARLDTGPYVAWVTADVPFVALPIDQSDVRYGYGPDSAVQPDVPAGETVEFDWSDSAAYPGTSRKFWVHVPAQYDPATPAALMVFQDGDWYLDPGGEIRGGIVLDNLIEGGDMPVTIGVFVDPGVFADVDDPRARKNRNVEYDAFDTRYVDFLLDEILPQVAERYLITKDPDRWGICGGGICQGG